MSPTSGTSPRGVRRSVLSNQGQTLRLYRATVRRLLRFGRISHDFFRLARRRTSNLSYGASAARGQDLEKLDDVLGNKRNAAVSQPLGDRHAIQRRMTSVLKASRLLRIFVVEDHPDTLQALCLYLKYVGHTVRTARTKEEALKEIPQGDNDVLISDIGLSDGNGWDLIREIGDSRPRFAIAMSGYGTAADHERSTEAGFRHHLIKPVSLEKLAAVLDEAIMEVHGR